MFTLLLQSVDTPDASIVPHVTEDAALAQVVMADLNERYPTAMVEQSDIEIETLNLDQGGSIMAKWVMAQAGAFSYWPHQIDGVLFSLNASLQDVREVAGTRFCKIANAHMMVCAYEQTVKLAQKHIVDNLDSLRATCKDELDNWSAAIASLQGHANIKLSSDSTAVKQ
jgi:hypothetical protein